MLKMLNRFNQIIKGYEQYLQRLEKLKEVVKPYHNKVYNKRIRDVINSVENIYIADDRRIETNIDVDLYPCYVNHLHERRFNAHKFIEEIDTYIKHKEKELEQMRLESITSQHIIDVYNEKVAELNEMSSSISIHFKERFKYKFDRVYL